MALTSADKDEIKKLLLDVLEGDNPGMRNRFVTQELCTERVASTKLWLKIILTLLMLTFSASGWAAVKATAAAMQIEILKVALPISVPK